MLGDVTGRRAAGMVVAHWLTALHVGVTKCADNISGPSSKRSQRQRKRQYTRETQEVEERSRWRWSPRRLGVHRNQDRFITLKGPGRLVGPLSFAPVGVNRAARLPPAQPLLTPP